MSWRVKHGSKHFSIASKGSHTKQIKQMYNYKQDGLQKQLNILSKRHFYDSSTSYRGHTTENIDPLFLHDK